LTLEEMDIALKHMNNCKSGIDGLSTEFLKKHFWKYIRKLLMHF